MDDTREWDEVEEDDEEIEEQVEDSAQQLAELHLQSIERNFIRGYGTDN